MMPDANFSDSHNEGMRNRTAQNETRFLLFQAAAVDSCSRVLFKLKKSKGRMHKHTRAFCISFHFYFLLLINAKDIAKMEKTINWKILKVLHESHDPFSFIKVFWRRRQRQRHRRRFGAFGYVSTQQNRMESLNVIRAYRKGQKEENPNRL